MDENSNGFVNPFNDSENSQPPEQPEAAEAENTAAEAETPVTPAADETEQAKPESTEKPEFESNRDNFQYVHTPPQFKTDNPYAQQAQAYRTQGTSQNRPYYTNPYSQPQQRPYQPQPQQRAYPPQNQQGQAPYTGANPYGNYYSNAGRQPYYQQAQYSPKTEPVTAAPEQNENKPSGSGKKIFLVLIAIILIGAIAGTAVLVKRKAYSGPAGDSTTASVSGDKKLEEKVDASDSEIEVTTKPVGKTPLSTESIAEKARESCVGVLVYSSSASTSDAAGQGSGILVSLKDKNSKFTYVLTCAHVIDDKNIKVKVQLENGTAYDAQVVGYDVRTDVGVLKIEATGLKVCEIGDSSALKVGSPVYAVGNPGGIEFFGSFTDGIVSAIDRPVDSEIGYSMNCIQHTAAINPGNSGGALVNSSGQVIGINSQKIASAEYEGMGFAIPINSAVNIANNLIKFGYVPNRAKLGITYYALSSSNQYSIIARYNDLPSGTLIINTISSDSSLANTKAKQYDMIIAVDGKPLDTADVLLEKIDKAKVGDKMTLTLCRINNNYTVEKFDIQITLVEDKGTTAEEETTTAQNLDPFSDFGFKFGW